MANSIHTATRETVSYEEYQQYSALGAIITDDKRRRPLWFDGRFLDAKALTSEQNYVMGKQADMSRLAGSGVVHGLHISRLAGKARSIEIQAGEGMTASGGLVVLQNSVTVDLANVPEIQRLDASFGLAEHPRLPVNNRSGMYVLALRPVEFTDTPTASYPTHINAERSVEDGHIVEATAVTLIPYPDQGASLELNQRRKHVVHEIFVQGSSQGQDSGVLPLALIALNMGTIQWLDSYMVRREASARKHDIFGLGLSPRALREAHFNQYQQQLDEVLSSHSGRLHASSYFSVLPAAASLPVASIDSQQFTQTFFPPAMEVELSIIPDDELPALLEDSYVLPPIDLSLDDQELAATAVVILIPVSRNKLRSLSLSLSSIQRPLKAAAPGLLSRAKPFNLLGALTFIPDPLSEAQKQPQETLWRQLLQGRDRLWYIRRRQISLQDNVIAVGKVLHRDESDVETEVNDRFARLDLNTSINRIRNRATTRANNEVVNLFSSPVIRNASPIAVRAAITEIDNLDSVDRSNVASVSRRFNEEGFGEGLARLEKANDSFVSDKKVIEGIAGSGKTPEIDRLARELTPAAFEKFNKKLAETAVSGSRAQPKKVATLVDNTLATLDKKDLTTAANRRTLAVNRMNRGTFTALP